MRVAPVFAHLSDLHQVVEPVSMIESAHARLRKSIRAREPFLSGEAAVRLIWLALRNITAEWSRAIGGRREAATQFAMNYEDCFALGRCKDFPTKSPIHKKSYILGFETKGFVNTDGAYGFDDIASDREIP